MSPRRSHNNRVAFPSAAGSRQLLQKSQREEVELAILEMSARLRLQTERIHDCVAPHHKLLQQLTRSTASSGEHLASVTSNVTALASNRSVASNWNLLASVIATFVLALLTILLFPR
jgi:hypothetical protein